MKTISLRPLRSLPLCAALAMASPLWAQNSPAVASTTDASAAATTVAPAPEASMGDAVHSLLQRQREGREASATPRPIDGRVADLSQQRYLKSFEQPLPQWFGSRVERK